MHILLFRLTNLYTYLCVVQSSKYCMIKHDNYRSRQLQLALNMIFAYASLVYLYLCLIIGCSFRNYSNTACRGLQRVWICVLANARARACARVCVGSVLYFLLSVSQFGSLQDLKFCSYVNAPVNFTYLYCSELNPWWTKTTNPHLQTVIKHGHIKPINHFKTLYYYQKKNSNGR